MSEARWIVPQTWAWSQAAEIARIVGGGTPSSKDETNFSDHGIPWITPADLTGYNAAYISRGRRDLSERGYSSSGAQLLPKGAVLFSSRAPIGYCVIAASEVSTSQGFKSFVLKQGILPEFIRYYLIGSREYAETLASGTTFLELSAARISEMAIPLAPPEEQERIVAKIDNLTSRTARARDELARLPELISKYRSVVLRLAFSGQLTPDLHDETVTGVDDLPGGWTFRRLGEIADIQGGLQVGKKRADTTDLIEVPYLRVANVQRGWLDLDEIKVIAVTPTERDRLLLMEGDILMNEGGDRDKLGRGWVWEGQIEECIHQNHVFRVRMREGILPPKFVSHFANEFGQQYFFERGKQTTNLASISKRQISTLLLPVPPYEEAVEIVRRIESAFAWLDRVSADHAGASKLLSKLDAAILVKAFRGELSQQDPNDEPAAALLERMRAIPVEPPRKARSRPRRISPLEETFMKLARTLEQALSEAGDWLPAQAAFRRCGIGNGASTEEIERIYAELRELDLLGKLDAEPVRDSTGRKLYDNIRLKVV